MQKIKQITKIVLSVSFIAMLFFGAFWLKGQTDPIQRKYKRYLMILEKENIAKHIPQSQIKKAKKDLREGKYENFKERVIQWGRNKQEKDCIYFAMMGEFYSILREDPKIAEKYFRYLVTESCNENLILERQDDITPLNESELTVLSQAKAALSNNYFFEFQTCFYTGDLCDVIKLGQDTYRKKFEIYPAAFEWYNSKFNTPVINNTEIDTSAAIVENKSLSQARTKVRQEEKLEDQFDQESETENEGISKEEQNIESGNEELIIKRITFNPRLKKYKKSSKGLARIIEGNFLIELSNRFIKDQEYHILFTRKKNDLSINLRIIELDTAIRLDKYGQIISDIQEAIRFYVKITEAFQDRIKYSWNGGVTVRYRTLDQQTLMCLPDIKINTHDYLQQLEKETKINLFKLNEIGTIPEGATIFEPKIVTQDLFEKTTVDIQLNITAEQIFAHEE